jgi:hypothetical protein
VKDDADLPRLDRKPSRWPLYLRRFFILLMCLAYVVSIGTLSHHVDWPDAYGFKCSGKCLGKQMLESHRLLAGGTTAEVALFLCIWFVPVVLGLLLSPRIWSGPARERIRPMGED